MDEESPGASGSAKTILEAQEVESMLERSTSCCHNENGKKTTAASPVCENFEDTVTKSAFKEIEQVGLRLMSGDLESDLEGGASLNSSHLTLDKSPNGALPIFSEVYSNLTIDKSHEIESSRANSCIRVARLSGERDNSPSYEDDCECECAQGIYQVRKDSALYLVEKNVDTCAVPKFAASPAESCARTRRESSGYFSNLGTFDEDRWSSPMDLATNQRDVTTKDILRERRRSSTKNYNNNNNNSSSQQANRIVCPTKEEKCSSPSDSENVIVSAKDSRVEMAKIEEQPNLEFNKSIIFDRRDTERASDVSVENCQETVVATGRQRRRTVAHRYSSPNIANTELERIVESGQQVERKECHDEDDNDEVVIANLSLNDKSKQDEIKEESRKFLPKSIKVYQLLSTQSEDRGDGDARVYDRRISLQIARSNENEAAECLPCSSVEEKKQLIHADSVPILKIHSSSEGATCETIVTDGSGAIGAEISVGGTIAGIRPIYPYCPYSPYASPQGSPRTNRRRPLRESRRVSIDSRQGALQLNQYKLLNNIGQGSYGIVKLAYNEEDDTHYAMKILSKKKLMKKAGIFGRIAPGRKGQVSNPLAKVYREIALLKKLDHPNVVKLVEVLDDPDEDNLYLVFELVQKGEVLELPTDKPLDEDTARRHFRDVVMGVEYLHYQRIVHRDIKPSNLLVDGEGRVKVADLGVSAELRADGELLTGSAGTPAFAAPETTTPGAKYSGTLCDVWSMGVTLYSLVTGKVPWDGAGSIIGVQAAVRSEQLRFPEVPSLSEELRDLISRMLDKDPQRRMTLVDIKEHSWVTNGGAEPLPDEADNCRLPVTVTDEEVARVVTRVPKLDTLILIKTMLKQHSFQVALLLFVLNIIRLPG